MWRFICTDSIWFEWTSMLRLPCMTPLLLMKIQRVILILSWLCMSHSKAMPNVTISASYEEAAGQKAESASVKCLFSHTMYAAHPIRLSFQYPPSVYITVTSSSASTSLTSHSLYSTTHCLKLSLVFFGASILYLI